MCTCWTAYHATYRYLTALQMTCWRYAAAWECARYCHLTMCLSVLQHVIGSTSWNPLEYAVVARKKGAVKALLTSYQITDDVNVFVPRVNDNVLKAAVTWGEPDVFQWLLLYHQGFFGKGVSAMYSFDVNQTLKDTGGTLLHWLASQTSHTAGRMVGRFLQEEPDVWCIVWLCVQLMLAALLTLLVVAFVCA